jgi:hypothetical protein
MEGFDFQVGFEDFGRREIERYSDVGKPVNEMALIPDPQYIIKRSYLTRRELPAFVDRSAVGTGYCFWG